MRIRKSLARSMACLLALVAAAQPATAANDWRAGVLAFKRIGVAEGITPEVITTLFRDRTGFLWVGTREGLFRYDGQSVERFVHDASDPGSISDDSIRCVFQDREGRIWIGTNTGGLNRLDPGTRVFRHFRADSNDPGSLSNDSVYTISQDAQGDLWVGTQVGLNRLDPETGRVERIPVDADDPEGVAGEYVTSVLADGEGGLWVGTVNDGLFLRGPGQPGFIPVGREQGFQDASAFSMHAAADGSMWIGGDAGLYVRRPGEQRLTMIPLRDLAGDPFVAVTSIVESPEGRILASSYGDGIFEVDPGTHEVRLHGPRPGQPGGLGDGRITGIVVDATGSLFAGTWGAGLKHASLGSRWFSSLTEVVDARGASVGLLDVLGMSGDETNGVWAASNSLGLVRLDTSVDPVAGLPYPLGDPGVQSMGTSVLPVAPDRVWLGTMNSLIGYDPTTLRFDEYRHAAEDPRSLGSGYVVSLYRDAMGVLWVGTGGSGLWRMEGPGDFSGFRHDPGIADSLSGDYVSVITGDDEGFLWIGTRSNGLNRCSPEPFKCRRYAAGEPGGLRHHHVTSIHRDREGVFWVGTSGGGLHRARRSPDGSIDGFDHLGEEQGLVDEHVQSIMEDDDSSLWIGTRNGLSRLSPDRSAFASYLEGDTLVSNIFNAGAAARNGSRLFFGTIKGILYLDAGTPFLPQASSPLAFTGARDVTEARRLDGPVWPSPSVTLPHGNVLELSFALLDFEPERHLYAYRLEDGGAWIDLGDSTQVIFADLPPGRHDLQVRGRGGRGHWATATLPIVVVPPFWMTGWFRALVVMALVLVALGIHLSRTRALRRRNRELQRLHDEREGALERLKVSERERSDAADGLRRLASRLETAKEEERQHISRELHDELGQTLTAAKIRLQLLQKKLGRGSPEDPVQPAVDMMDSMIGQVRTISLNLRPPLLDEAGLVPALRHELKRISDHAGVPITLAVSDDFPSVREDIATVVFRVVQEAVSNSLRHSGASRIAVSLEAGEGGIRLRIEDDGCGFEVREVRARALRGEHLGLLGLDERVIAVGGTARLDSAPGKGTRLHVEIPYGG